MKAKAEDKKLSIEVREIKPETLKFVSEENARAWCRLPYPGSNHKHGCPNECQITSRADILQNYAKFVLVIARYDLATRKAEMKILHPKWSEKQCGNIDQWQGHVKAAMKATMIARMRRGDGIFACGSGLVLDGRLSPSMEACCIHVLATLARNKIKFEPNPRNLVTMVGLICKPEKYTCELCYECACRDDASCPGKKCARPACDLTRECLECEDVGNECEFDSREETVPAPAHYRPQHLEMGCLSCEDSEGDGPMQLRCNVFHANVDNRHRCNLWVEDSHRPGMVAVGDVPPPRHTRHRRREHKAGFKDITKWARPEVVR